MINNCNERFKSILINMGLHYLELDGKSYDIEGRTFDLDFIIIKGSLIILAECGNTNSEKTWETKKGAWKHILDDKNRLIKYVKKCNEDSSKIEFALKNSPKIKLLAVNDTLDNKGVTVLKEIDAKIWNSNSLEYFSYIAEILREDASKELFCFLGASILDIDSEKREEYSRVDAIPIISEADKKESQMYIIWMKPNDLIKRSFVIRKDGWNIMGFQRMLIDKKLKEIREYLINSRLPHPFPTTIIVSLNKRTYSGIKEDVLKGGLTKLYVPNDFNSFCIIDGQHRLYSFTQRDYAKRNLKGDSEKMAQGDLIIDKYYKETKLPVLCLVYDQDEEILIKEQAKLFSTINQTQTSIKSDLLYDIEEVINPFGSKSIASKVLKELNSSGFFSNKFNVTFYHKNKIKRPSILTWGILPLVSKEMDYSFYKKIASENFEIEDYIKKCTNIINSFFLGLNESIPKEIKSKNFYTVASLNGFFRLIRHFIQRQDFPIHDLNDILKLQNYFKGHLKELKGKLNLDDEKFHKSSHWGYFEKELVEKIGNNFGISSILKR